MYKVKDKFIGHDVSCNKFSVNLSNANQDQLEHLFNLGHAGVEYVGKKQKNKQIDNFEEATNE